MKNCIAIFFVFLSVAAFPQSVQPDIFSNLSEALKTFKVDTTAVPNDALTDLIRSFRKLKGGFNINEALEFQLAEAQSKNEISKSEYEQQKQFWTRGKGRRWLDNAVIWIYRNQFTAAEMEALVQFYQTEAGRKMAEKFPLIMIESAKAAEWIGKQSPGQPK